MDQEPDRELGSVPFPTIAAAVAVTLLIAFVVWKAFHLTSHAITDFGLAFLVVSPLWTPIAFGAYAVGNRQYGIRFLLTFVTAEALSLLAFKILGSGGLTDFGLLFLFASPFWTPIAFGAYAVGSKQYGIMFLIALVTAEALSVLAFMFACFVLAIRTAQLGGP